MAAVDSQARTREVRLTFVGKQAPTARPLVGTAGQLRWSDPRLHIPGNVLVPRADSLGVFVVDGGVARYVPVAGAQAGRASPVDLDESQLVITQGQYGLQDGDPVEVTAR